MTTLREVVEISLWLPNMIAWGEDGSNKVVGPFPPKHEREREREREREEGGREGTQMSLSKDTTLQCFV
jgi:hypothetical protein